MKNILTIIKKEFFRMFTDRRMLRTILLPGVLIYVIYSLMGSAIYNMTETEEDYKPTAYIVATPASLASVFSSAFELVECDSLDAAKQMVSDGNLDIVAVFPDNFDELIILNQSENIPNVQVWYDSVSTNSYSGFVLMSTVLNEFNTPKLTINVGGGDYDLASDKDTMGQVFSSIIPMLIFSLLASACVAVAPESIAGEKERGTIATLLITPIKRWQLAIGKIVSLSCFAILSGISSFLGVALSLPKLVGGELEGVGMIYTLSDYFIIFAVIISIVLVIISLFSVLSALAKSVKEAGTIISPAMIAIILLGISSMFFTSAPSVLVYCIPILGSALAISSVLSFAATPLPIILAVASNLVIAAALIVLLAFMFKSEKVMFNK